MRAYCLPTILMLCLCCTAQAFAAPARRPAGYYGVVMPNQLEAMGFRVRRSNISELRIAMLLECRNSDTGESYLQIFLVSGENAPDLFLPRSGKAAGEFAWDDGGRSGLVSYEITVRQRRANAVVAIVASGGYEQCEGANTYPLRRAPVR